MRRVCDSIPRCRSAAFPRPPREDRSSRSFAWRTIAAAALLLGLGAARLHAASFVIDFRQGSNQNPNLGQEVWLNGILNTNNSEYFEGMVIPQRVIMLNIPATSGNVHHLTFHTDATKGSIHAFDFLGSYGQAVETANAIDPYFSTHPPMTMAGLNPCGPAIGPPNTMPATCSALRGAETGNGYGANAVLIAPPGDPFVSKDGVTQSKINAFEAAYANGQLAIYGNAAITNASIAVVNHTSSGGTTPLANGTDTGDTTIHYVLTWTSSSNSILFEFGAHLSVTGQDATGYNWGPGLGASYISGGSYHVSLDYLDPGTPTSISLGSQDNQIMANAVTIPPPTCGLTGPASVCAGSTTHVYTSTTTGSGVTYAWSITGSGTFNPVPASTDTTATVDAGASGSYTVTVVETSSGGSTTCTVTTTLNANPTVQTTGGVITCSNTTPQISVTSDIGTTFSWTNHATGDTTGIVSGAATATPTVNQVGVYDVVVTSAAGCSTNGQAAVTLNTATPTVSIGPAADLTCTNTSDTLTATHSAGSSILWSTGATTDSISVSSPGTYSVVATDGTSGCQSSAQVTVGQNTTPPTVSIAPAPDLTCTNTSDTLTATHSAGSTLLWSTGATTDSISVSSPGTYSVVATAANGCTASAQVTVGQNTTPPTVSIGPAPDLTCTNTSDTLTATHSAGSTLLWSTGATTDSISVSSPGTYSVVATAANGCTASAQVTVGQDNSPPTVSIGAAPDLTCVNLQDVLTATHSAGSTLLWSTGATSDSITVTSPGTYSVVATAANGCTASAQVTVGQDNTPPTCSLSAPANIPACGSPGNTLSVTTDTGTTFSWSVTQGDALITNGADSATITYTMGTQTSTFSVTVTAANGCTSTCTVAFGCFTSNEFCTVTPGFWGSAAGGQGKFNNVTAYDLLTCLLSGNPLTIGVVGTRSLTITDAACIISRFPSSGTPTALPDFGHFGSPDRTIGGTNCNTTQPQIPVSNNGRFKNILLGETATLILNVRMDGGLGGFVLPASISTVPANAGPDGTVGEPLVCIPDADTNDDSANFGIGCSTVTRTIPAGLVGLTVNQLIVLANQALAGIDTGFTYSQINQAVTAINEAFDKCRFLGSCPAASLLSNEPLDATAPGEADR